MVGEETEILATAYIPGYAIVWGWQWGQQGASEEFYTCSDLNFGNGYSGCTVIFAKCVLSSSRPHYLGIFIFHLKSSSAFFKPF